MNVYKNPKTILEDSINDLFKFRDKEENDFLFKIINIILLKNSHNSDMSSLLKIVNDYDLFAQIIHLFSGRKIEFIEPELLKDTILLAVCYYYKRILLKDWDEIQKYFGSIKLDKLSLSHKMYNIDIWVRQKIQEEYRELKKSVEEKNGNKRRSSDRSE